MSTVGQIEKATQARVVALLQQRLGYTYLGNWIDQDNANIDTARLTAWLKGRDVADILISRALHELTKAAGDASKNLYDRNKAVYEMLRYGIKVQPGAGENHVTIWLIDWQHPEANHFGVAEEVTVKGADLANAAKASTKRPDVVLYVNGIALGVLELKRSTVSVSEGIRQNLDNQKKAFIQPFFTTMQWVMAGNDTEGLRYATTETPEKYWLQWVELDGPHAQEPNLLDRHLLQVCDKRRFLELVHDFIVFDAGTKKVCRQNQYFGVKAAQNFIRRREGGIIWHTQGSGKSLTMVWLAKWIRENRPGARVLIITDRTELDEQIEKVFKGVNEQIYRTKSGSDLIEKLNGTEESLLCSLVHKFGRTGAADKDDAEGTKAFIESLQNLPPDFQAKGDVHVFVDECHRTQSGDLHKAMKAFLPNALFIGFTGTPLLKADAQTSLEVFGGYIHTYKFAEAVQDGVVLDLVYEARDIDQTLGSPERIDQWFEAKTRGLNDWQKDELKKQWGTMQNVLSSRARMDRIVMDIIHDFAVKPRLSSERGNAILVASSIHEACKYFALFGKTAFKGRCAVVTSYNPQASDVSKEETGANTESDKQFIYNTYTELLKDVVAEPGKTKTETYEQQVKDRFIKAPAHRFWHRGRLCRRRSLRKVSCLARL